MDGTLWAIIAAAGTGSRVGSPTPKQFMTVAGKPVLGLTLERIMSSPFVSGAVVVLPVEWYETGERIAHSYSKGKCIRTAAGGSTRQESVRAGLALLPEGASWVLVHDASRPNVSREMIEALVREAFRTGAAVPFIPVYDALRAVAGEAAGGPVIRREEFIVIQTPQVFSRGLLVKAHLRALEDQFTGHDDSELVERIGFTVSRVPGSRLNFKITTCEDFFVQDALEYHREMHGVPQVKPVRRYGRVLSRSEPDRVARTGIGVDVHRFGGQGPCVLGGMTIPGHPGLEGHSDGDVICHAVMDALLGAAGDKDIGHWFPQDDPRYQGAFSLDLLRKVWLLLAPRWKVVNVDVMVVAQRPRLTPYSEDMRRNIARALDVHPSRVSVKATTPEHMGDLGRGEGILCLAVASLLPWRREQCP